MWKVKKEKKVCKNITASHEHSILMVMMLELGTHDSPKRHELA